MPSVLLTSSNTVLAGIGQSALLLEPVSPMTAQYCLSGTPPWHTIYRNVTMDPLRLVFLDITGVVLQPFEYYIHFGPPPYHMHHKAISRWTSPKEAQLMDYISQGLVSLIKTPFVTLRDGNTSYRLALRSGILRLVNERSFLCEEITV
jgi:hypothetical protein